MQQISIGRVLRPHWRLAAGGAALGALALINRRRALRAEQANPPIGKFLEVDGARLHYVERGDGDPILLIHGNGTMVEDWIVSGLLDDLAATHRVVAVDRPGFGHSSRPRGAAWTVRRQAEVMAKAMRLLGMTDATVVGHSFGTLVALALALDHPALAKRLVLIGGYYFPSLRLDAPLMAPAALPLYGQIVRHTLMPVAGKALRGRIDRKLFGPATATDAWRRDFPMDMALRPSRLRGGAADAAQMIPAAARLARRYRELKLPITVVAGRGDRMVRTKAQSERLHQSLPHSRLVLLDDVGHMAHHSDPEAVAAAIRMG
jgi:pimeloyl-ACP methyl ester carboxylesterase